MPELPEEFAPRSPRPRFATLPDAPVRPRLLADESRFAIRLSLLAGAVELCAFAAFARLCTHRAFAGAVVWAALRVARPLWASLGTVAPRGAVAFVLVAVSLAVQGAAVLSLRLDEAALLSLRLDEGLLAAAAALPALGDLCATCLGERIPLDRRAAGFSYLDIGQGMGVALGIAAGTAEPRLAPVVAVVALLFGSIAIPDLRGRPGPKATFSVGLRVATAKTPFGTQGSLLAFAIGGLGAAALVEPPVPPWTAIAAPLAGMWLAARVEPHTRNAVVLPRVLVLVAGVCALARAVGQWPAATAAMALVALGAAASALPASVARGSGELERPVVSSLVWSAFSLGAGLALAVVPW